MNDEYFLKKAIELAKTSNEPIKCASILIDSNGNEIASEINTQREDNLTASHAEMKSIANANKKLGRKLKGITAYGNCEPCTMCLTALIFAGIDRVVFANLLNDLVGDDQKINIDFKEFTSKFPNHPIVEYLPIN